MFTYILVDMLHQSRVFLAQFGGNLKINFMGIDHRSIRFIFFKLTKIVGFFVQLIVVWRFLTLFR